MLARTLIKCLGVTNKIPLHKEPLIININSPLIIIRQMALSYLRRLQVVQFNLIVLIIQVLSLLNLNHHLFQILWVSRLKRNLQLQETQAKDLRNLLHLSTMKSKDKSYKRLWNISCKTKEKRTRTSHSFTIV